MFEFGSRSLLNIHSLHHVIVARGAPVILPKKYKQAFFLLPMFGVYYHLTLWVLKVTKCDVKERHRAKDERELLFSMKVSLDLMMKKTNVKDPEVVGFLVRGNVY